MTTATPPTRQLVTGGDPERLFTIPKSAAFEGHDFKQAPELDHIGWSLIDPENGPIVIKEKVAITFLWKRKGGQAGGNFVLGKCIKLSGLSGYFGDADFVIWLAADHLEVMRPSTYQVEGLLFHELSHIDEKWEEDDDGNFVWKGFGTRGHDFEGFKSEVERYGFYRPAIQAIAPAFQARLPLEARQRSTEELAASPEIQRIANDFVGKTFRPGNGIDSVTFKVPGAEDVTVTREDAEAMRSKAMRSK